MDILKWIIRVTLLFVPIAVFWLLSTVYRLLIRPTPQTFGTARWATKNDISHSDAFRDTGLIVGRIGRKFLRFNGDGVTLLFAKMRAGKGVGVVIPNLLEYPGSVICTDIKGENTAITRRHRETFGSVFCLNLETPEASHGWNPLDFIRTGTIHEVDDARALSELLVTPDPQGEDHWDKKARNRLTGFLVYLVNKHHGEPYRRTLTELRRLVMLGPEDLRETLQDMAQHPRETVRETANDLIRMADTDELSGVLSSMEKATELWAGDSPLSGIVSRSDFTLESFSERTATLYVIVPEEKLAAYQPFLRLFSGLTLYAMMRQKQHRPPVKPLILLDEAAALGRLIPLEKGMGYIAEYARLLLVFQDLGQLEALYHRSRSFIANSACQIAFGVNDFETAEALSKRIGQYTVKSHSEGKSRAPESVFAHNQQAGESEAGRWLLDPSEILRMRKDEAVIFMQDEVAYPIRAKKVRYYEEKRWKGLWDRWRDADASSLWTSDVFSGLEPEPAPQSPHSVSDTPEGGSPASDPSQALVKTHNSHHSTPSSSLHDGA